MTRIHVLDLDGALTEQAGPLGLLHPDEASVSGRAGEPLTLTLSHKGRGDQAGRPSKSEPSPLVGEGRVRGSSDPSALSATPIPGKPRPHPSHSDEDGRVSRPRLKGPADRTQARDWGPRLRLACPFGTFRRFRHWLDATLPAGPAITLYGSGDFHHVTLALLGRVAGPFNLLVLDKHPDWMRGIPFLHCGTWLHHALKLPNLRRVFHCGGELDFDNGYRHLAPWPAIRDGRVVVFPARRRFDRGRWSRIAVRPLQDGPIEDALRPFRDELAGVPLYISIDKDVLVADDAAVNWDSGLLRLGEAVEVVESFRDLAGGRLAGADLLGDWSPIRLGHRLNRICDRVDHPSPDHDPAEAAAKNARANAAFLRSLVGSSIADLPTRFGPQ